MRIVVTAATSTTANGMCDILLQAGHKVRGMVRNPGKLKAVEMASRGIEIVRGSYLDESSLEDAFEDADGVFVLLPPCFEENENEVAAEIGQNICKAANSAEVGRVVAMSSLGSDLEHGTGCLKATHILEKELENLNANSVILRPAFFFENWQYAIQRMLKKNELCSFISPVDHKIPQIATCDVAELACKYLVTELKQKRTIVECIGPQLLSTQDIADIFSKLCHRDINAYSVPDEELDSVARKCLPFAYVDGYIEMTRATNKGLVKFNVPGTILETGKTRAEDVFRNFLTV